MEKGAVNFEALPEGCIAHILSFTTPRDVCRSSLVSPIFKSAAESDAVWDNFLPPDYQTILSRSADSSSLTFSSRKDLYFTLSDHPILIDGGKKSFALDKRSGKKCYMLAARDLKIEWGETQNFWNWISLPESRFTEVAELIEVWWLEISGKINTGMLSPSTTYVAYLVFKLRRKAHGFDYYPEEVSVGIVGVGDTLAEMVCMDPAIEEKQPYDLPWAHYRCDHSRMLTLPRAKERKDGWLEIKLGEFFNDHGDDGELELSVKEVKAGIRKGGLIVQGIDIRPKQGI